MKKLLKAGDVYLRLFITTDYQVNQNIKLFYESFNG